MAHLKPQRYRGIAFFNFSQFAYTKAQRMRLQVLIENGAEVDVVDNIGETPLHIASKNGHLSLVEVLVESNTLSVTVLSLDFG